VTSIVSSLTGALAHMSGTVAVVLIAVLVFGETAIFLGFVLPGEAAVVFGGVLGSRGHLSLPALITAAWRYSAVVSSRLCGCAYAGRGGRGRHALPNLRDL
jgi:membrane protein DedA with SNARE-associated domain